LRLRVLSCSPSFLRQSPDAVLVLLLLKMPS
jgi:hypothetical protein